jgi:hypothetical protein
MAERDLLLKALVAELLGPRGGAQETLAADEDPLDEYISGVLAPHEKDSVEPDADDDLVGGIESGADDQADPGGSIVPARVDVGALPSPTLDPRSRPASLGISFTLEAGQPAIDVCCTWARYKQATGGTWQRQPLGQIWASVDATSDTTFTAASDPGVRVQVLARQMGTRWRVSVFLINVTQVTTDRPQTSDHVFQPQIRIVCSGVTKLVPIDHERVRREDPEENSLGLLYRNRRSYARGHLCSATWKEIDPQRPHPSVPLPMAPPFHWIDGDAVFTQQDRAPFVLPQVRTEYVPIVPVNAPEKTWPAAMAPPELDPDVLAETWDPADVGRALHPLADGYETWINGLAAQMQGLQGGELQAAQAHIATCRDVLARIRDGIALLTSNVDARLAFCFANRAIALQSRWTKQRVNPWWPFQLAFQLVNLRALSDRRHHDRRICDLLWFPTGGGKTEAYLGLAAFTMAHRRLAGRAGGQAGSGVAILSRYTLRLLTIQQFRRALALVTAAEFLRVEQSNGAVGWRPRKCPDKTNRLWGGTRFAVGLWVGGGVTPNGLHDFAYKNRDGRLVEVKGALSILEGAEEGEGEPAQVLSCPACTSILAIPPKQPGGGASPGYQRGDTITLHLVLGDAANASAPPPPQQFSQAPFDVAGCRATVHANAAFSTWSFVITLQDDIGPEAVDAWVRTHVRPTAGQRAWVVPARGSRPGYFIRTLRLGRARSDKPIDFEIFCPNPKCDLNTNVEWSEQTPTGTWPLRDAFTLPHGVLDHCPIPAWTVDEQLYQWCPSMVVSTVDKFARLSFEPRAGVLFGNVERYNQHLGYFRSWIPPSAPGTSPPSTPQQFAAHGTNATVARHAPPDLILQDELHLIEGPLGSMVGLYESVVDVLASTSTGATRTHAKYIASTATVRNAEPQVQSLYGRTLQVFPPPGLTAEDSFFARSGDAHPLDTNISGRVYAGVCAPGRGAQTPIVRIWSRLLQQVENQRSAGVPHADIDPFWTLIGYFNAIRELAGAVALTRQDIAQRLATIGMPPRRLDENEPMELSSRADSMSLPALLGHLAASLGPATNPVNVAVATSMFGTGVDVDRLGLMVVHGQPKTTSAYIQATGRVGRRAGGLVVTFFRAARPRDLNHYEFFCAYHQSLYRFVEPITVNPFAPRARDRALGPVAVALLRQAVDVDGTAGTVPVHERWRAQQRISGGQYYCLAQEMARHRRDPDVEALPRLLEARAQMQPAPRRPPAGDTDTHAASELDVWQQLAARGGNTLVYFESTLINPPSRPVVLGDLAHEVMRTGVAYEDAPNSLRDVESTVTIKGWR